MFLETIQTNFLLEEDKVALRSLERMELNRDGSPPGKKSKLKQLSILLFFSGLNIFSGVVFRPFPLKKVLWACICIFYPPENYEKSFELSWPGYYYFLFFFFSRRDWFHFDQFSVWQCVGEGGFFYYITLMEYHHLTNRDVSNLLKHVFVMN